MNQAMASTSHAALRYVLADGAGAVVLERDGAHERDGAAHVLLGTHVESVGGARKPGMEAGIGVVDATRYRDYFQVFEAGSHHLDQDFAAVLKDAGPLLLDGLLRMLGRLRIDPDDVDHFVWSVPSLQLYAGNEERFRSVLGGRQDRAPFRGARTGYCGGASVLVHLDEMARAGAIRPGEVVAVHAVESSKWMSAGFVVRW
jgi:3-oxoacyl-[acyl-carrier-protein] synthase III